MYRPEAISDYAILLPPKTPVGPSKAEIVYQEDNNKHVKEVIITVFPDIGSSNPSTIKIE